MDVARYFASHEDLAWTFFRKRLVHQTTHLMTSLTCFRVWKNVQTISKKEGGDSTILTAATMLHDCVDVPKNSPLRASASRMAAAKASTELLGLG